VCRMHVEPVIWAGEEASHLWSAGTSRRPKSPNQGLWGSPLPYAAKIAIIDDDTELRQSLGGLMRSCGIEARLFESGDAFLAADPSPFDCVIADVHMPGIDGISLIKRLRGRGSEVPVIIISALDPERTREQALAGGAQAYFSKPVDPAALLEIVTQLTDSPPRELPG